MSLDENAIRQHLGDAPPGLEKLEVFAEIASTNSYLMQRPAPASACYRVAVTDNQTAGRGRHGRRWHSPPGSGLCLSMAYRFASKPDNLSALTLAVGLGVIHSLKSQGIGDVQLKWPNDLIAGDGKLGGVLTETQSPARGTVVIVTGIGLNVDLGDRPELQLEAGWAQRIVDLSTHARFVPDRNALASSLVRSVGRLLKDYDAGGFDQFRDEWQQHDWLRGRSVTVETARQRLSGIGVGVAEDGALLIDAGEGTAQRISSGTVTVANVAKLTA